MPKLPVLSWKEVVRAFEKLGFFVDRQRGSHVVLKKINPTGTQICIIPMHKEVKQGTLRSALHQARVSEEEFRKVAYQDLRGN